MNCKCCSKEVIQPKMGREKIFCCNLCRSKYNSKVNYYKKYRNNEEIINKKKLCFKNWYDKNKEKQKNNMKNIYNANKNKFKEREYANKNRDKILKLLKKECHQCSKKVIKIIHHEKYDFPKRLPGGHGYKKLREKYLIEYVKYLLGFCSRKCHCEYHKNNRNF